MTDQGAKLRVLVVDDEQPAREILGDLLTKDPEIDLVAECKNGNEALEAIRVHRPDLVFLDVQMPGLSGFDVLASLRSDELPLVVFATAYDEYAVRAFEIHALDYLLKPFDDQRFEEALGHAKAALRQQQMERINKKLLHLVNDYREREEGAGDSISARLTIRSGGRVHFVKVEDIDWIEAADYYARIHALGKGHLLREPLSSLEKRLDPHRFARVHRSAIVNLDRVREVRRLFKGSYRLILEDGTQLKVSRHRRADLETKLARSLEEPARQEH